MTPSRRTVAVLLGQGSSIDYMVPRLAPNAAHSQLVLSAVAHGAAASTASEVVEEKHSNVRTDTCAVMYVNAGSYHAVHRWVMKASVDTQKRPLMYT